VSSWDISASNFEDFNVKHGGDYVVSTRIRIARNLASVPLGTNISREQRQEVERLANVSFDNFTDELKGTYYALGKLTPEEKKQLKEDHFLFKEGDRFLKSCGCERDW
jgi:protein-arginine kinase